MANLQVKLNDDLKAEADMLFASLGLDTSTAVRIFLTVAVENGGLPFKVCHKSLSKNMDLAIYESRNRINLYN
ncbi:MAG: type II toxin-antitoxin system RelB/DinJ family antitoxin [bacterium]|nr:type II toxin-antitoxin system RelB/DinJ family antitoxin [bacterium]